MAAIYDLPVLFVCENNLYGASTAYARVSKVENVADRAGAYGMASAIADGMDVFAVYAAARQALQRARSGGGPTLLELKTFRLCGHSRRDPNNYMSKEEKELWAARDPIPACRRALQAAGFLDPADGPAPRGEVAGKSRRPSAPPNRPPSPPRRRCTRTCTCPWRCPDEDVHRGGAAGGHPRRDGPRPAGVLHRGGHRHPGGLRRGVHRDPGAGEAVPRPHDRHPDLGGGHLRRGLRGGGHGDAADRRRAVRGLPAAAPSTRSWTTSPSCATCPAAGSPCRW